MGRSPYPGFTALNRRRHDLIRKKYEGGGLTKDEAREMEMLGEVVSLMCDYRWPTRFQLQDKYTRKFERLAKKIERRK